MDINKVWLSGLVICQPVQSKIAAKTPSTVFSLEVNEKFQDRNGLTQIRPNTFKIESLGKSAERTFNLVKQGQRYTIDGYLRSEGNLAFVRTFAVYPDDSMDTMNYREGLKQALEILRKSRDLTAAQERLEDLLK